MLQQFPAIHVSKNNWNNRILLKYQSKTAASHTYKNSNSRPLFFFLFFFFQTTKEQHCKEAQQRDVCAFPLHPCRHSVSPFLRTGWEMRPFQVHQAPAYTLREMAICRSAQATVRLTAEKRTKEVFAPVFKEKTKVSQYWSPKKRHITTCCVTVLRVTRKDKLLHGKYNLSPQITSKVSSFPQANGVNKGLPIVNMTVSLSSPINML